MAYGVVPTPTAIPLASLGVPHVGLKLYQVYMAPSLELKNNQKEPQN